MCRPIGSLVDDTAHLTNTVAEIHLGHLRHNARVLLERAAGTPLMAVVKADAYGHGVVPAVKALQDEGIHDFATATVPEGIQLRAAGIEDPILVFAAPLPAYLPAYVQHRLDVTVSSAAVADAVLATAPKAGPLRVHIKVETGMGRIGVAPEEAPALVRRLAQAPGVRVVGLWTHFATASEGDAFAQEQMARFQPVVDTVGHLAGRVHVVNSDGLLFLPQHQAPAGPAFVRTGIALYGMAADAEATTAAGLRPVMRFTSRVTHIKEVPAGTSISYGRTWTARRPTRIATVGAGYADGYTRLYSNRAEVGIRGTRFPVAGTVCMDMFMVDLGTNEAGDTVAVGDEVVLFGPGGPSVFEAAAWAETITYEVCCRVAPRVPRHYLEPS